MAKTRKGPGKMIEVPTGARYEGLKKILEDRRRDIMPEVQGEIRDIRVEGVDNPKRRVDHAEIFDSKIDIQEDIEFALIQMKAVTLQKINEALARLKDGTYGYCFECGDEIAQPRLRALPFAVRCNDCEEAREMTERRERIQARRSDFFDF